MKAGGPESGRMSGDNKGQAVGPRKLEDLSARCMQNCSIQVIPARMSDGNKRKAVGPRKHEDLTARGRQNSSIQVILARMLRELRGKLWALENMRT